MITVITPILHTLATANAVLLHLQNSGYPDAKLIGSFGNGIEFSEHDIDILLPSAEISEEFIEKMSSLLSCSGSISLTDWGGVYFKNTRFGDIDIFFNTNGMLTITDMKPEHVPYVKHIMTRSWEIGIDETETDINRWLDGVDGTYCLVGTVNGVPMATAAFDTISDVDYTISPGTHFCGLNQNSVVKDMAKN